MTLSTAGTSSGLRVTTGVKPVPAASVDFASFEDEDEERAQAEADSARQEGERQIASDAALAAALAEADSGPVYVQQLWRVQCLLGPLCYVLRGVAPLLVQFLHLACGYGCVCQAGNP